MSCLSAGAPHPGLPSPDLTSCLTGKCREIPCSVRPASGTVPRPAASHRLHYQILRPHAQDVSCGHHHNKFTRITVPLMSLSRTIGSFLCRIVQISCAFSKSIMVYVEHTQMWNTGTWGRYGGTELQETHLNGTQIGQSYLGGQKFTCVTHFIS